MSSQQHEAAAAPNPPHLEKPLNNGYLQANVPLEELSATVVSPLLGQQQVPHQAAQQQQQQQNKLPTVVFLAPDGSGGVGIQRGSPAQGNPGGGAAGAGGHSDWLLKESQQRRRLLVLAIAFTVLGAAIGALAIYFASVHQRCQLYHLEPGNDDRPKGRWNQDSGSGHEGAESICMTQECVRTAASLLSAMDLNTDPCEDFFQYACGTWNKMHPIPEDRSSISTFEVLSDQQQVILRAVLEEPIDERDNRATIKAKTFFKSCMDIPQIRKIGTGRLREVLESLGGWPVIERDWSAPAALSVERLMGLLRLNYSEPVMIELYVGADDKNSSVNILQMDQLQYALPSRDYYLKESSANDRRAYHRYMTQVALLLGADPATAADELEKVVLFETQLVNVSLPEADRHDTSLVYRKMSLPELQELVPEVQWQEYLQAALGPGIPLQEDEPLVTYGLQYLTEMGRILARTDRRVVHNYMLWRLVMSLMSHMIDEYQRERVEFRKILMGIQSERTRWSQCVEWTNKKLGVAVGALFIRDNFNQESKEVALEMIHTIRAAFNELLAENDWMDDETRAVAKEKADSMNERIGYPELLTNATELEQEYVNLTIVPDNFINNVLSILQWESEKMLRLLRQPVDKEKWTTEPAVVNAFYNPNKNDIVFPAGILQPLFYSQHFPKSLNYGGIGVVIGHEITHGFDDKGRQFDKEGNMMQWWNNATIEAFRERTQCVIDQYSRYKINEVDMFMDGRMTQGENIADNGGLKQAFRAYKKWETLHGREQQLPGLNMTHDQLFFLNYAQIWCGSMRPEDALTKIRSAVHSPGFVRVLGPLSNSRDFASAYNCPLGSTMNPAEKCSVW
ncbi:neprilysin-1 [Drosophila biarmipes]|uniref:neprilysin-1 n=1 Tax=Drosophila biarmipes TaxID=125945 RepID=UPI0007E833E2|nr:neprilysin-1 [Drosophila biarmipes]XP_016962688.1 neprilysin-1 [Drosophila biarmipes]XP_016962689.1 neprilysin-1 [Drosophila biarmipes]XP_050741959.1 neprilysin-1 [Drosophila biarmipes]XP_050741988.1 neprilysin-1 [Drosophila biarmipes]XP_050742016.1 neprilysin-1 [Drosophila biarmipes]